MKTLDYFSDRQWERVRANRSAICLACGPSKGGQKTLKRKLPSGLARLDCRGCTFRKLEDAFPRAQPPIVYRNHGPKFRKPRHFFCHRPQSKQELQSTSCHRGTNLCATVLCLFVHLPCAQPLDCTQDTCAACIFCTVRLVLVLHELQVVCHKRLRACRSCVGFFHIYTCPLHVQAFSGP